MERHSLNERVHYFEGSRRSTEKQIVVVSGLKSLGSSAGSAYLRDWGKDFKVLDIF